VGFFLAAKWSCIAAHFIHRGELQPQSPQGKLGETISSQGNNLSRSQINPVVHTPVKKGGRSHHAIVTNKKNSTDAIHSAKISSAR
jgi:hypothetical protein